MNVHVFVYFWKLKSSVWVHKLVYYCNEVLIMSVYLTVFVVVISKVKIR